MNPKDPERVLDAIAHEHLRQDLNLLPGILAQTQPGNPTTMKTATKLRFAALALALVLLITLLRVPGVASALKTWFGYIPGVGTVDQSAPLRVLAAPVSDTRDGFTMTVESALLDSTHTVIHYRISGPFPIWGDPTLEPETCQEFPVLRLPNGSELGYPSREYSTGAEDWQFKDLYTAIPADQNSAVLVLPCLAGLPAGEGPQDWEIPLAFAPAPPEMTVFPVIEQPVPQTVPSQAAPAGEWMQLTLQGVAELEEGYYLQAALHWQNDPNVINVEVFPEAIHMTDASGYDVAVWPADQIIPPVPAQYQTVALNLQTAPIYASGPAELVVDYVGITQPANAHLTINLGESPQPGQVWQLNQDLEINGYHLRVLSAEYVEPLDGKDPWLELNLEAEPEVVAVTVGDPAHELMGTGGSPNTNSELFPFRSGWRYKGSFPSGTITAEFTSLTVRRNGPWSLTWTPPATSAGPAASTTQLPGGSTCLDANALKTAAIGLPEGLDGRVAFMESAGEQYEMLLSRLDGSERVSLGVGLFPDLSPDGQKVVHQGPDKGLYILHLISGESVLIPGTLNENMVDFQPEWSPDGQQIAFTRYGDHKSDIYLVNADGSNLRPVVDGPEPETFLGWGPDSRHLYYWTDPMDNIMSVQTFDLRTGESGEMTEIAILGGSIFPSLSPDGKRIVYMTEPHMFLLPVGANEPELLIPGPHGFGNPTWSPDGQWIALPYWEPFGNPEPSLVLLQVDTCRVYRLPEQTADWLLSWVP